MFWFPMIIYEYTVFISKEYTMFISKASHPPPLVMSGTNAQNALYGIFKAWSHSVRYTTRILWCIINNYWMRFIVIWRLSITETLIILHITKTESKNCFIIDFKPKITNMARKTIKNKPRRLNMQITDSINSWLSYLLAHNWVICRLRDSRIYLHVIDQSQCIKQLQYIMKLFM